MQNLPHVRCLLRAHGIRYRGESDGDIHAEAAALKNVPLETKVDAVEITSEWLGYERIRRAVPCADCCALLAPRATEGATVRILDAGVFKLAELADAYQVYDEPGDVILTVDEARGGVLPISAVDYKILRGFVFAFRDSADVYLTGTASGRGGARAVVNERILGCPYKDIDVVIRGNVVAESIVTMLGHAFGYAGFTDPLRVIKDHDENFCSGAFKSGWAPETLWISSDATSVIGSKPPYAKDPEMPSAWDISYGSDNMDGLLSPQYYRNNWYVRVTV